MSLRELAKQFKGKTFTDKDVAEACEKLGIDPISAGELQDHIYQLEYDERMAQVIPLVLEALSKLNYISDDEDPEAKDELEKANEQIEYDIAKICEDNGVRYLDIVFLRHLSKQISDILLASYNRISNMGASVFAELAKKELGDELEIKALAEKYTEIAKEKAGVQEVVEDAEDKKEEEKDGE